MSGPGNGGDGEFRKPPSGGATDQNQCNITERANLNSVDASVVSALGVGDSLIVELQEGTTPRVLIRVSNGEVAGSITSRKIVTIIECLRSGFAYAAEVKSISGGLVEIEINPA